MKQYNSIKLITETIIDLDISFTIEYGTEIPDTYLVKDVYGQFFLIPLTSILYFYCKKEHE